MYSSFFENSENNSEHDNTSHEPFADVPKAPKETRNKQRRTSKEGATRTPNNKKASSPVVDEILQEEDYYKILGTTKDEVSQAPKPDTVIQKLVQAAAQASKTPAVAERLAAEAAEPATNTPKEFAEFIKLEAARWSDVVKKSKIKAD